jgi:hypothetical protein
METFSYQFENKEDREMAFHNIVKWYGDSIVKKIEFLELNVKAPSEVHPAAHQIVVKHLGRLK